MGSLARTAPAGARRGVSRALTWHEMLPPISRRRFLVAMAGAVAWTRTSVLRAVTLRVGLVAPVGDAALGARLGALLGADEAARAAALFGGGVELLDGTDARALLGAGAAVLLGGFDDAECARLVALTGEGGTRALFLNLGATGDALRAACRPHAFHVAPSEGALRAARAAAGAGGAEGAVALWHPSLEKFGAAQLNDRFRARFGRGMSAGAWAAWFAVKAASEAALRARSAEPAALAAWLARPGVRFDGHKGAPLTFGAGDHQLRQPLYLVRATPGGSETAVEIAPVAERADPGSAACTREDA
jgi:hypothetical protein